MHFLFNHEGKRITEPVEITAKQRDFIFCRAEECALIGGVGSGKSRAGGLKAAYLAYENHRQNTTETESAINAATIPDEEQSDLDLTKVVSGMIISRTSSQLDKLVTDNVIPAFVSCGIMFQEWNSFKNSQERMCFTKYGPKLLIIRWHKNNYSLIYLGTTEQHAYKRWAGSNLAWILIDELDTMPYAAEVMKYARDRVRVKARLKQIAVTTTPEGLGFCYDYYVVQPEQDPTLKDKRVLFKTNMFDNVWIDRMAYYKSLKAQYSPKELRSKVLGEFLSLEGDPVMWAFSDKLHSTLTLRDVPGAHLHLGLDFNKNINHCSVSVQDPMGRFHTIYEIVGAHLTVDLIERIDRELAGHPITIYPDASGTEGISQLRLRYGEDAVVCGAANPDILNSVTNCNMVFQKGLWLINPATAPKTYASWVSQTKDKQGKPDKTKGFDHGTDGTRYKMWQICNLLNNNSMTVYGL